MAIRDGNSPDPQPADDWFAANAPATGNWWEGPPPAGFTGTWPPPLPTGASYGPNLGQIIMPTDATGAPTTPYTPGLITGAVAPAAAPTVTPTATPPATGGGGAIAGMPTTGFGAAPDPYRSAPWTGGDFVEPTLDQVKAMPGYQARLDAGLLARQRSAAAQGTILNGGTQKALERYGQDYATGEVQTARGNAYQDYLTRYGQAQDANARTLGEYTVNTATKRAAEQDYWSRLQTLYGGGQAAATGSYRF